MSDRINNKKTIFKNGIYCCLDDTNSGFGFDTEAYSLIYVKNASFENIIDALLKKRESIDKFPKDGFNAELNICDTLTFMLTNKCNMKCTYCYYKDSFDSPEICCDKLTAEQILDYYKHFCSLFKNGVANIQFFGGEPLIETETIFKAILLIEEYCRENETKAPNFGINTNGLLFNKEIIDFFYQHKVSIAISLDGKRESNVCRVRKDGSQTFDDVMSNVKLIKSMYPDYPLTVETTFTTKNVLNFIETKVHDVEVLYNAGFSSVHLVPAMLEIDDVLNPLGEDFDIDLTISYIKYAYDFMFKTQKKFMVDDYYGLLLPIKKKLKRNLDCFSGVQRFAITPGGEYYPCHIVTTNKDFLIKQEIVLNKELFRKYVEDCVAENSRKRNEICGDCWCRNICYNCRYQPENPNVCTYKRRTFEYLLESIAGCK